MNTTITRSQPEYPRLLYSYKQAPDKLYCEGDLSLLNRPAVAIIGSRDASSIGKERAYELAQFFAGRGYVIISGLAMGCDTAAHEGALSIPSGKTIAILPSSLDDIKPKENFPLARRIVLRGGLLLTQYATKAEYNKFRNYQERDYLQAVLSLAVVPVQGETGGGTRFASWKALELGRLLFVPRADPQDVKHFPLLYGLIEQLIDDKRSLPFNYTTEDRFNLLPFLEEKWKELS